MYECPRAVPEDPQYEENLPRLPLAPGLTRTEALAGLCALLRQQPERNTTIPSLSEIAGDERIAKLVLSMLVEQDDAVTGHLLAEGRAGCPSPQSRRWRRSRPRH